MAKITYSDKVGIIPKTVRINQVWDDDMNEIKLKVNDNGAGMDREVVDGGLRMMILFVMGMTRRGMRMRMFS